MHTATITRDEWRHVPDRQQQLSGWRFGARHALPIGVTFRANSPRTMGTATLNISDAEASTVTVGLPALRLF
jgi:hypothetical protein